MSSSVDPVIIGLVAAGLALVLIAIIAQTRRPLERMRLRRRQRRNLKRLRREVPNEPVYRSRTPTERSLPTPTLGVAIEPLHEGLQQSIGMDAAHIPEEAQRADAELLQEAVRQAEELVVAAERQCASLVREAEAEAQRKAAEITEGAQRRAREQLEQAELEAKRIVDNTGPERALLLSQLEQERSLLEEARTKLGSLAAIQEATRTAEALLVVAEQRRVDVLSASEAEAERRAAEVTDAARRQAQQLLEDAQFQAARILADARHERTLLVEGLERSVLEDTRTRLSGFLTNALEEVAVAPAANVRDLHEARAVRTSTGADH